MSVKDIKGSTRLLTKLSPLKKQLMLFVALPTALSFLYFAFIESPMYVSETQFAVRSSDDQKQVAGMASVLFNSGNSTTQDSGVVYEYIRSSDVFEYTFDLAGKINSSYKDFIIVAKDLKTGYINNYREQTCYYKEKENNNNKQNTLIVVSVVVSVIVVLAIIAIIIILKIIKKDNNELNIEEHEMLMK